MPYFNKSLLLPPDKAPQGEPPPDRLPWPARFVLVAAGYYVTALLSLNFGVLPGVASPFWPPAGFALWACLEWGAGMAPALWLGATVGLWASGLAVGPAALASLGAGLEALLGAQLVLQLYGRGIDFIYQQNIFRFVGIAALTSVIGAGFGTAALSAVPPPGAPSLLHSWLTWWVGDATGMIVAAPLLLTLRQPAHWEWSAARRTEAIVFAILLPIATEIAFGDVFGHWPLSYLPVPFIIWAAFRFNLATVTWTIGTICVIAVWNTASGHGPFIGGDLNTSLLLLMVYVAISAVAGLALASLLHQRNQAERKLTAERDELERRVQERTEALRADIEARARVEQQLEEAQHLAQIGSWNWDAGSGAITWSDELYRIYGVSRADFAPTPEACRMLIHGGDVARLDAVIDESVCSGRPFQVEHRIQLPSGESRIVAARGTVMLDEHNSVVRLFGTVQDVTESKQAEAALREAEERYRMVVELSPDAILVQQDGIIVFANPAAALLLHAERPQQIVGKSLFDLLDPEFHAQARTRIATLERGDAVPPAEKRFVAMDGVSVDFEVSASPFLHKGRFAVLYIMHDVTERKKNVAAMAYLAHYDSLTGLPNRMLFQQRLAHALSIAQRPGRSLELLFLDLDRFKNINDTLGHAAGDSVLRETATRLQGLLRESDTVARLGGDEFVVLVENVDEPHRGGVIAEKILAAFRPPFICQHEPLAITTSIGISSYPSDGSDAETLLKTADIAMYRAKEMGRNNYRYYSAEMNQHTAERLSLEYALSSALEGGQLSLYYQPKVDVLTNRISGMEALLRWHHPTLGLIQPQRFIPIAEETGLIRQIGYWAIRTACRQNREWQEISPARLKVAVNLSPRQLADDLLVPKILAILDETGLTPRYLELEITESAVMDNPDRAIIVLNMLRDMGITVAIDDFGTGYSSLAYLKRFPIRAVKIDQSFVQGIPASEGDAAITRAIISLAHSLECSVIAEGAETRQQYDFLREHECDSVQGYYFSKPMNAEMFGDLLRMQADLHVH